MLKKNIFYVASYSKIKKGIYVVDYKNNKLTLVEYKETDDFPSYIIKEKNNLYITFKNAGINKNGGGNCMYKINNNGTLCDILKYTDNHSYTHLCKNNDFLFTANYHEGTTTCFNINECYENKSNNQISMIKHNGSGPDSKKRQLSPHVHYVGFTPDKKFLYSVDLGSDKVFIFNYKDGVLKPNSKYDINVTPGSGPRHMIFSGDGKFSYLVNEISNTVNVYLYKNNVFTLLQSLSTLPKNFNGESSASAIRISTSGKYLFISNRGHDSIVMYKIDISTGKLSLLSFCNVGSGPRDFNFINKTHIIVGLQGEHKIKLIDFNEKTETLELKDVFLEIEEPVCIAV
ncbi:hypothetical protein FACS189459_2820 [Bacilli bacterium]|nr:hypothetical protein FACS189459_2820 [Bacilli bacterium]GHU51742.1 hypothetical protein FACS189496_0610 [Bacilli bacterium]